MGLFLLILSQYLVRLFGPVFFIYGCIAILTMKKISLKMKMNILNSWMRDIAIGNDQLMNVVCRFFLDDTMLMKESRHAYGKPDETISSVYGKNARDKTLTKFGWFWSKDFLDRLEKDHSIKSIEDDE